MDVLPMMPSPFRAYGNPPRRENSFGQSKNSCSERMWDRSSLPQMQEEKENWWQG